MPENYVAPLLFGVYVAWWLVNGYVGNPTLGVILCALLWLATMMPLLAVVAA